jgi:hypothetical protein
MEWIRIYKIVQPESHRSLGLGAGLMSHCGLGGQTLTPSAASRAGLVSPPVPTWYSRSVNGIHLTKQIQDEVNQQGRPHWAMVRSGVSLCRLCSWQRLLDVRRGRREI